MSTIKRCISLMLVFFLLLGQWSPMAAAVGNREIGDGVTLSNVQNQAFSGSCGEALTWTISDDGVLTISGTGEMTDYADDMPAPWFEHYGSIRSVVIEHGVQSVGNYAFLMCGMGSLIISDSVTSIGEYAFRACNNLEQLQLGGSLSHIGTCAFAECNGLVKVTLCSGVETIIGQGAFTTCENLCEVEISSGVLVIEDLAFSKCVNLRKVTISETVQSIGATAFLGCLQLEKIIVDPDNGWYSNNDQGFLMNKEQTELIKAPGVLCGAYSIPNGVTSVQSYAFAMCENLAEVTVPGSVENIGACAFQYCHNLNKITFEGNAPIIGEEAFFEIVASIYYPIGNGTWIPEIMKDYGGKITYSVDYSGVDCNEWGHSYEPIVTAPTCTDDGRTIWICYRCGDSWSESDQPALGHSYETVVTEPTCTEAGYTTYTCSVCGSSYVADETEALGHSYESVVVKEATLLENGELTHTCSVCGYSYTEVVPAYLKYKVYENYVEITKYTGNDIELVIPAEIEGRPVTCIGANAFSACSSLQKIVIPDGITSIGYSAFAFCRNLADIAIPESVTSIGNHAFSECSALTSISLPSGIETIGDDTFAMCGNLAEIAIPYGVTAIGSTAFRRCTSLSSISIPDSVTSIGSYAFENCTSLGSVNFDGDVPEFGRNIFFGVTATAYYPAGNPTWTEEVMQNHGGTITWESYTPCAHDYTVVIKAPTCTEGGYTRYTCSVCGKIYVERTEALGHSYMSYGTGAGELIHTCTVCGDSYAGVFPADLKYNVCEDHVEITRYTGSTEKLEIPDVIDGLPVTAIMDFAFMFCDRLISIDLPDSITFIGEGAFADCYRLTAIDLPDGLTAISYRLFAHCDNLTSVDIPVRVTSIDGRAFDECSSLASIDLPGSITSIGSYAFNQCRNLDIIRFRGDAPKIGTGAFEDVTATAHYPAGNPTWTREVMQSYGGNINWVDDTGHAHEYTAVITPPTCTEGGYTTYTCTLCGEVYVADETEALGHNYESVVTKEATYSENGEVVYTCTRCGDSYTEIIPSMFSSLQYVIHEDYIEITGFVGEPTELIIPAEIAGMPVTVIGDSAFYRCYSLKSISIPDGITAIGERAFQDCNFSSFTIPDSVTSIGKLAFAGCTYLRSVSIPKGVTVIEDNAFDNCWELSSVSIPDGVTSIGKSAFWGCYFSSVSIPASVAYIGDYAFEMNLRLTTIYFNGDAPELGKGVFDRPVTAYYPAGNPTWTEEVKQSYGSNITWVAFEPVHTHEYTAVITAPTCTKQGYTTHTCICGDSYVDTYVDALGHDMGKWSTVTEATCTEDGSERRACSRCDHYEIRAIEAIGHSFGAWFVNHAATCTVDGENRRNCNNCSHYETEVIPAIGHKYKPVVTAPTCTEKGYTTHTCANCGDSYVDTYVDALGHDMGNWTTVTEATCTKAGSERRDCSRCDHYEDRVINATGHNYKAIVTAPTCTAQGFTTHTCANCGDSYMDTYVGALGHNFAEWTVVKKPTVTAEGQEARLCQRCGMEQTRTIACPKITQQPTSVTVAQGKTAKVSVTATGDGLTYKWYYKNAGDSQFYLTNSFKSNTYSITMDASRNGRQVYCAVTDKYGNILNTNTVTLKMETPLAITKQPVGVTVANGKTAAVSVAATGDGLTYKWYYKNAGDSQFYLTNSFKSNTYSITMDASRNGRQIYCVISDQYGNSVQTNIVTLKMATLTITKQPVGVTVAKGKTATVHVNVTGEGLTFKWYYKNAGDANFYLTNSFKSNIYAVTMNASRNGRQVYCVITDKYGNSVQTNTVTLKMENALTIVKQPVSVTVANGKTASVYVNVAGSGLTFKWYYKNAGDTRFYLTNSFKSNTYSVTMDSSRNGRQVYCVISDKYGNTVKTNTVTLKMATPLAITQQPVNVTVANGATASTTVVATGDGLSYTWYVMDVGAKTWTKSSITSKTYAFAMTAAKSGRHAYCVVTDANGNKVTTETVTFNMTSNVTITTQSVSVTVDSGKTATVKVTATGTGLTYKWYYKNPGDTNFYLTNSFKGNTYSVTMDSSRNGRQVYCVISDSNGNTVATNIVSLKMK